MASDPQHQRSSSNIIISNPNLETGQQVENHFNKSLDNLNFTVTSQQQLSNKTGLPPSFYIKPAKQPSTNHSRDGSTDSSGYNSTQSPQSTMSGGLSGLVAHSRAHSSPATLTSNQLSIPLQQQKASRREAARSAAISLNPNRSFDLCNIDDDQPLPAGWERTFNNGQPLYINRDLKMTMFTNPRDVESFNRPTTTHNAFADLGPLPYNWEESYTPDGHKYFINHDSKITTWYDPRLPEEVQRPTILQRHSVQQNQQQQMVGINNPNFGRMPSQGIYQPPTHSHHMAGANLPSGSMVQGLPSHMMASNSRTMGQMVGGGGGTYSPNSQKRVQDLNRERQSYRMRQEEIMKQGLLSDHISSGHPVSPNSAELLGQYSSNDQQIGDFNHGRNHSTDSGLGMATFGYSHPHTPENFLNTDFPPLNIAGIDLNLPSAMEVDVDNLDEIPEISQRDLDQVLNYPRSTIRY